MTIFRTLTIMAFALMLGFAISCKKEVTTSGNETGNAAAGGAKTYKIALIAKSSTNPVFLSARTGADKAAEDLSKEIGVKIEIEWLTPPNEDGQVQAQKIEQAANEGVDAILLSCSDASKVTAAIDAAVERGIPVMTFDSDAPDSKRFAFYGVDDIKSGEQVMDELAKALDGKGVVAILAGNQNAPNLQKRVEGVKKAASERYPDIRILDTFYHTETPQDAAAKVSQTNKNYHEITGWAMIGGWPLFTTSLLDELANSPIKIVAVDALPAQLPYVDKGIVPVLLAQPTFKWGYVSVQKIIDKIHYKRDVPVMNEMELIPVTKDNLGCWAQKLVEWKFESVPDQYVKLPCAKPIE